MPQKIEPQGLASYRSLQDYTPRFADFVMRCGWFRSWVGVVNDFDAATGVVSIVMEGTPKLLFTMHEDEQVDSTFKVKLNTIKNSKRNSWSVQQIVDGQPVWFI